MPLAAKTVVGTFLQTVMSGWKQTGHIEGISMLDVGPEF
jgi:hypothetical protein